MYTVSISGKRRVYSIFHVRRHSHLSFRHDSSRGCGDCMYLQEDVFDIGDGRMHLGLLKSEHHQTSSAYMTGRI